MKVAVVVYRMIVRAWVSTEVGEVSSIRDFRSCKLAARPGKTSRPPPDSSAKFTIRRRSVNWSRTAFDVYGAAD